MLMKIVGFLVAIFVVVWIFSDPVAAGHDMHSWITGLFAFFGALAKG
jgi:hypothetical protein